MFNRQPFNRGRFNTSSGNDSFHGETAICSNALGQVSAVKALSGDSGIVTHVDGRLTRSIPFAGMSELLTEVNNSMLIKTTSFAGAIDMALSAAGDNIVSYGYEYIKLPELTLLPGDELVINTESMTVELNGINASKYFSNDSEFFYIRPGENVVIYESGAQDSIADIRILWKDAFL